MTDPQASAAKGEWIGHDGPVRIRYMNDDRLLNCYKTCIRHSNPKADELREVIADRRLTYRIEQ